MVITTSDVSQEASPCKGTASSAYFPAVGTRSAPLPCRALYAARVLLGLHLSELGLPLHLAGYFYPMSDFRVL